MRIRRLDVVRFGALRDRSFELERSLIVVRGPNEAGKSSFHGALETILYGFEPAGRDTHPYATWDGSSANLHLEAELELDSGARLTVERLLMSSPTLRIGRPGEGFQGRRANTGNRPLPELEAVPRPMFRAVYSLTANDTRFKKDELRHHVRELLLGEKGLDLARPLFEVRAVLERDLRRTWKPDNTGNHRAKRLRAQIKKARQAVREARSIERQLSLAAEEEATLEAHVAELRERRRALVRESDDAEFLAQIAELRRRADRLPPLRQDLLGGEPIADPEVLRRELEALEARLAGPRARLAREAPGLGPADQALLGRAGELAAARAEAARHAHQMARLEAAREASRRAARRARGALGRLSGEGGEGRSADPARLPALEDLRAAADAWRTRWESRRWWRGWILPAGGLGLVVLVLAATGALAAGWAAVGALLLAAPLAFLLLGSRTTAASLRLPPPEVERLLVSLHLEPTLAPTPEALVRLLERLEEIRGLWAEARAEHRRARGLQRAVAGREESWRRLVGEAGLEVGDGGAEGGLAMIEGAAQALDRARQREALVRKELAAREKHEAVVAAHAPALDRTRERLARVEAALRQSFPDQADPAAAFQLWNAAERERHFVRERERDLRRDPRWEVLHDDAHLDSPAPPWGAAAREAREARIAALDQEVDLAQGRLGKIRAQLDGDQGSHVARAQERVEALQAELQDVRIERDRLALLERVLGEAERSHREKHQPDVLRRAGEYLKIVTGGRYTLLDYPEGEEQDLHVLSTECDELVPVDEPLSRGTREQIYLCLRLGTLDYLDRGRESLPLVLDEALVHWDEGRRARLMPLLGRIAERRQVVLFTCHANLAAEAASALEVETIDLSEVEVPPADRAPDSRAGQTSPS